jgi:hypothetical protein
VIWPEFQQAFDYASADHARQCHGAKSWQVNSNTLLWNFNGPPDECQLVDKLASSSMPAIDFIRNTYPGWRSEIPSNFFHCYYKAKPALLCALPYPSPPKIVIHLRGHDGEKDDKRGLDEESLLTLGILLADNGTYLVTNRPDWYTRFHE